MNTVGLYILLSVLIAFIVLQTVLSIVFIIALRKRRPVVKVIMAPQKSDETNGEAQPPVAGENNAMPAAKANTTLPPVGAAEPKTESTVAPLASEVETVSATPKVEEISSTPPKAVEPVAAPPKIEQINPDVYAVESDKGSTATNKSQEIVRLDRSFTADLSQLSNESKEWYSVLKNELLSYDKVKVRMDWKSEAFSIGRSVVARLVVRSKQLCLLLAVEPAGYAGTKYSVENASNVAEASDTPTLYAIKSGLRLRYAKDMIAGFMGEVPTAKNALYEVKDFYVPYAGDVSLMRRGLIKRVTSEATRTNKADDTNTSSTAANSKTAKARR